MKPHAGIRPETLSAFLEGLPDLLESLRAQGYGPGPRQHVAAHELVGALSARGGLPPTLLGLDEWLAPLVCYTPAQQEDFRDRYLHWLVERRLVDEADLPAAPPPVVPPEPPPEPPAPDPRERITHWAGAHRRLLFACGAALCAAALLPAYLFYAASRPGEDLTQVVRINPDPPPPTPVPLPADEVTGKSLDTPPTNVSTTGQAWDVDRPADASGAVDLSRVELDGRPPAAGFWARNYPTLLVLAATTPFACLGLWHFLRRRRRRRDAERSNRERPRYDKIKVRGARERVFQSAALRPVARGLRHYLSVGSRHLDARATVLASVGRGGLFTPVYGRRRTLPEYLVLIDRVGFGDQLAQFHSDIVARLGERDVYLDAYYFHGDPRRCREAGPDSPQLSLSDLAARHPDHYLLVFSDGTGLMSTTTGRPEPFVEQLSFWRGRALLTPVPRLEWEYREWALEREGLKVLPASLDGLRLLVEAVSTGARRAPAPAFDETPPYPDILRQQPALWKEREAPPPHQTRRLLTHLRRYLGPRGFELLCACAVYPIMQWGVTLFLAHELLGRREVDALLPRLLRLPWFRHGTMPPWLRRTLVRELPRARRRLVRERLEHLLLAFLEDPGRGLRPRFEEERAAEPSLLARLNERVQAWRRSRRLRRRLEPAPARSPLAEPVFLNFITDNQRAEALPEPVRHRLFPRGVAAFGLRLAPAAALVAVAALTGLLLLLLERPVESFYTPGAPPNLMALLLAQPPARTTDPDFIYTPTTLKQGENVDVTVNVVTPGAYDLGRMRLAPADTSGKVSISESMGDTQAQASSDAAAERSTESLSASINVAPDTPTGPTELLLYDGAILRARLPFNVTAAAPAAPQPCPTIVPNFNAPDIVTNATRIDVRISGAQPGAAYTYFWSTEGGVTIRDGQGTRSLWVIYPLQDPRGIVRALKLTVGGFPATCANVLTIDLTPPRTPAAANPSLSVERETITVCPRNPKLNEPPDSVVSVRVNTGAFPADTRFNFSVSAGKFNEGVSRAGSPVYTWDLSGVTPGIHGVRADALVRARVPAATAFITVRPCADDAQGPPPLSRASLSDAAQTTDNLKRQAQGMATLKNGLFIAESLTPAESSALTGGLSELNRALAALGDNLRALGASPAGNSRADLPAQVDAVYSALKVLEDQVSKVRDGYARGQLLRAVRDMQSGSARLDQLRQTPATSPGDE